MHVLFFTQGAEVPAARFRVNQIVPALRKHVECTVMPANPSVYGDYDSGRSKVRPLTQPMSVISRFRQLGAVDRADVVWLQRPMTQYFWTGLERRVAKKKPMVFDFDDAIFHNRWGLEAHKLRRIINASARVVAGNQYLADFAAVPEKTTIIPTVVDENRYTPRDDPDGPFTIVWTGLSHNLRELAPYRAALERALAETGGTLVIVSDALLPGIVDGLPVEFVRWSPDNEVTTLARGHVGIMPLADTPYNRGKCAFKLIQYMARAIPVIASPVGANVEVVRDGVEGLHARTPDDWTAAVLELARDRERRVRFGAAGRRRIEDAYSVTAVVPKYLAVLEAARS
jgi:glycosyltransferase involved in cell wall biosynthesis